MRYGIPIKSSAPVELAEGFRTGLTLFLLFVLTSVGCTTQRYSVSETVPEVRDVDGAIADRSQSEKQQDLPASTSGAAEKVTEKIELADQSVVENTKQEPQNKTDGKSEKESQFLLTALTEQPAADRKAEEHEEPVALPMPIAEPAELPSVNEDYSPAAEGMTLAEFEQLALDNNPTIKLLSAAASRANGIRNQVGAYPNPTVGFSGSQLADQGTDQHVFFYQQQFVRGNKLALNERVLSRAVQAQMWDVETQRYRVLTDVRLRYYDAVAAQRIKQLASDFASVTQKGAEIAKSRRAAGEGTEVDVLQAEIQMNQIQIRQQQAEFALQGAWKDLTALTGMPYLAPAPIVDEMNPEIVDQDWDSAYQSLLASSPELSAAQMRVSQAKANLDRQKVQAIPNLTVQLGAGADNGTNSGMLNVQVSAPLPVYNKNRGNISAAYAQFCQATHEVKRIELSIKSRLAKVSQEYDAAKIAVLKYQKEILPKAEETLKLSEEAYRAGELNFLQMLIVRRTYFEANLQAINATRRLAQAQVNIDGLLLTGGLDKTAGYTAGGTGLRGQSLSGQ